MADRLIDDNGVIDFLDDNGVSCFVDDLGNFTCVETLTTTAATPRQRGHSIQVWSPGNWTFRRQ